VQIFVNSVERLNSLVYSANPVVNYSTVPLSFPSSTDLPHDFIGKGVLNVLDEILPTDICCSTAMTTLLLFLLHV